MHRKRRRSTQAWVFAWFGLSVLVWGGTAQAHDFSILENAKERGALRCGIVEAGGGITARGEDGNWRGFFPDICRYVAAAIFADETAVEFLTISDINRFDVLASKEIDLLTSNTTWTARRDLKEGIRFAETVYYDGQGFMAHKSSGLTELNMIFGRKVSFCVIGATTTVEKLKDLAKDRGWDADIKVFSGADTMRENFYFGRCDIATADRLVLASMKKDALIPDNYVVFPEIVSKEPLSISVPANDDQWFDIVRWSIFSMILAEELGISSETIQLLSQSDNKEIQRLIGADNSIGYALGLNADWAYQALLRVGNYAEIYSRNLGEGSTIGLDRGLNTLWRDGGLLYAPPM